NVRDGRLHIFFGIGRAGHLHQPDAKLLWRQGKTSVDMESPKNTRAERRGWNWVAISYKNLSGGLRTAIISSQGCGSFNIDRHPKEGQTWDVKCHLPSPMYFSCEVDMGNLRVQVGSTDYFGSAIKENTVAGI